MADDEHAEAVTRIRSKLATARRRRLRPFGAEAHGFDLGPPLPVAEVAAHERRWGVRLPAAYRAFVTQVGHGGRGRFGGAGPFYGLYPLADAAELALSFVDDPPADWLQRPSPLRPHQHEAPAVLRTAEATDEDLTAWYGGLLGLGTQGCGIEMALLVSGAHSGRVAYLDPDDHSAHLTEDADFLAWYERWLDDVLGGGRGIVSAAGPRGDEPEPLLAAAGRPDRDPPRRNIARTLRGLRSFFR